MRVRGVVKAICKNCYVVKRGKRRYVYCTTTPKHKQRQGFHSFAGHEHFGEYCVCTGVFNGSLSLTSSMRNVPLNSMNTQAVANFQYRPLVGLTPLFVPVSENSIDSI